jgi:hypothetical protein
MNHRANWLFFLTVTAVLLAATPLVAAPPVVKTVWWDATNETSLHPAMCDVALTLKGTSDQAGTYQWDPADGSGLTPAAAIGDRYAIQKIHTYTTAGGCAPGNTYAAKLRVTNAASETTEKIYYVGIFAPSQVVQVDRAIDEGLWALHKGMTRSNCSYVPSAACGKWSTWQGYYGMWAAATEAFFSKGHTELGSVNNPYTETAQRAISGILDVTTTYAVGVEPLGNADSNGNGLGIAFNQSYQGYQTGMLLAAIVASAYPTGIARTGPANVVGRQYKDIAQDVVDYIAAMQYDDNRYGGWRYSSEDFPDNSACQWNAIGLISAERGWGLAIPPWVKTANANWLTYSHNPAGYYGYTDNSYLPWGSMATTPSGLVQAVMDGIGRGDARWNSAETWMRTYWNGGTSYAPIRTSYVYALFSFAKAMLQHNPPIVTFGADNLDWYGDPVSGAAKALLDAQYPLTAASHAGGWWSTYGQPSGEHYSFITPWAIMILNKTTIETGRPIAVAKVNPTSAVVGQTVTLDGSGSFHQAAGRSIIAWNWTVYNGATEASGIRETKSGKFASTSFSAVGNYLVKLVVTDDAGTPATATDQTTAVVSLPPYPPVAKTRPARFCNQVKPWILDASLSTNPDDGRSEPGFPGDFIKSYGWDLDVNGTFGDASGVRPDVTAYYSTKGAGTYLYRLRVTDNTATSFPHSGFGDLSSTADGNVILDGDCACVTNLAANAMRSRVDLSWQHVGADKYMIYRKTTGAFAKIGETTAPVTVYSDLTAVNGTTYTYMVKPFKTAATPQEYCESNSVAATPRATR